MLYYGNSSVIEVTCGKCKWALHNGYLYSEKHYEIAQITVEYISKPIGEIHNKYIFIHK